MTMDLDSTVCEVHGHPQAGRRLRLHPYPRLPPACRHPCCESGEVLHARQRTGRANTASGAARFVDELAARMDSGFWSAKTINSCRRRQLRYSITVRLTTPIRQAIAAIEDAWVEIVYPEGGVAQIAETRYQGDRLVVRRNPPGW